LKVVRTEALNLPRKLPVVATSSHTGDGLPEFCREIRKLFATLMEPGRRSVVASTAERCRESIRLAATAISAAIDLVQSNVGEEIVAAELRVTLAELGNIVGAVYTDDLLDRIFKTFCIGK
jgi:tRNA modification GTPase